LSSAGLTMPQNFGDSAAVFAAIVDELEKTVDETRSKQAEVEQNQARTRLQEVRGALEAATDAAGLITAKQSERTTKQGELQTAQSDLQQTNSDITSKQSELTGLRDEKSTLEGQLSTQQSQLQTVNNRIAAIDSQLAGLDPTDDAAQIAALNSERRNLVREQGSLETAITNTTSAISQKDSQISVAEEELLDLQSEKTRLEGLISDLESDINTLNQEIAQLNAVLILSTFFFIPLLFFAILRIIEPDFAEMEQTSQQTDRVENTIEDNLQGVEDLEASEQLEEALRKLLFDLDAEVGDVRRFTAVFFSSMAVAEEILSTVKGLIGEPLVGEVAEQIGLLGALNKTDSAAVASNERVKLGL
ncbi:MAG: hypothetical protein AAGF76_10200, partial [Pseudomonadota bacterium]